MSLNCLLVSGSDVEHLQQIYTGFGSLHRQGIIKLHLTIPKEFLIDRHKPDRWVDYKFYSTKVVINGAIKVCYDTHDWNWIDENILSEVDFYFKRSYDTAFVSTLKDKNKVYPLGLNYQVVSDKVDFFRLQRSAFFGGKEKIKHVLKSLRLDNYLNFSEVERLDNLQSPPDFSAEPRVLFMARVWNPENLPDLSQKQQVNEINKVRAETIKILRQKFGDKFFGGIMHDEFSEKHFKDVLLPENSLSNKRKYLEILKSFPICVATTGLNNSIGWKFAEYIAFSKAIVTESLKYQVSGDFKQGKNYLEFNDPNESLDAVSRLFEDSDLRNSMMKNNFDYYQNYVRPDALILNTLKIVANQCGISLS